MEWSKTWFNSNSKRVSLSKITTAVGLNISSVTARKACFVLQRRQEELQSLWDKAKRRATAPVHHGLHREERLSEERHSQEGHCQSKRWRRWS